MITPRPASTLILVRDTPAGIEVLLLQRTHSAVFMPGVYVFPGGAVDEADASEALAACCAGLDDAAASRLLGVESGGLAYAVAAIRECFEEAGLLLACDTEGRCAPLEDAERSAAYRSRLVAGELSLAELCEKYALQLGVDGLAYFSHWVTPPGPPRRYDTRFFVAVAPDGQVPSHDGDETVNSVWIRPADALDGHRRGEFPLSPPTIRTLKTLSGFDTTAALMAYASAQREILPAEPRFGRGSKGKRVFVQGDPVYAELDKLDREGKGTASYEIVPGTVTWLSSRLRRLTAPNPSFMTGPGTNTYIVGADGELAVIDPGPDSAEHVRRILQETGERLRWVLVTHTHLDHSPAAQALRQATGAELLGMPAPPHAGHDASFQPNRILEHGERLRVGDRTLRVIHTPGHASNHLCYLLEEERLLISGDHIMQGSTVVISPPDGDMAAYLRSLDALLEEDLDYIAPAHGFLIGRPHAAIDRLMSHRLAREGKVAAAVRELGPAPLATLLVRVYEDVPERMHRVASRSLLAHLLKLEEEGVVSRRGDDWLWQEAAEPAAN